MASRTAEAPAAEGDAKAQRKALKDEKTSHDRQLSEERAAHDRAMTVELERLNDAIEQAPIWLDTHV